MTFLVPKEALNPKEPGARQVLFEDLLAQPDLNRHIAIAWARLSGNRRAVVRTSRVTVLKPFTL
jgi:hypothetical protein